MRHYNRLSQGVGDNMGSRLTIGVAAIALWAAGLVAAQESSPNAFDALDRLDNALLSIRADSSAAVQASLNDLRRDILDLQLTLTRIQEVLDDKTVAIAELEDENEKLREALRVRYRQEQAGVAPVPVPNRGPNHLMVNNPGGDTPGVDPPAQTVSSSSHTIVSEWGRSPETVAELPGNVSSLIGLAAAVPPGMSSQELEALARKLRHTYDAYDNINIQVFDNIRAAKNYADLGKSSPRHLVLSISKHKHSERDNMIRFTDGRAIEVR